MTISTSRDKTYKVDWIDGPTMINGLVMLQLADERSLADLAQEFSGLEWIERKSESQGDKRFEGFTRLMHLSRIDDRVQIGLGKEA